MRINEIKNRKTIENDLIGQLMAIKIFPERTVHVFASVND